MNDAHQDNCHDEQLSRIYQQSRIEEPPMALDSAILTQARKAVEVSAKTALWRPMRWMIPLASTAIVLLTASLFIQMKAQQPQSITEDLIMDAAPLQEPEAETLMRKKSIAPVQEAVKEEAAGAAKLRQERSLQVPAPATLEKQSSPAATRQYQSAAPPVQADAVTSDTFGNMMGGSDVEPGARKSETDPTAPMQVKVWLKQIRALIRSGKLDEAGKSLQEFRKSYPDENIPEDIISVLK